MVSDSSFAATGYFQTYIKQIKSGAVNCIVIRCVSFKR